MSKEFSGDFWRDDENYFAEGQWWLKELDAMVENGTHDQRRAVAVVRKLIRFSHALTEFVELTNNSTPSASLSEPDAQTRPQTD